MLNILIVDDSLKSREQLADILTKLGHHIVGATDNGIDAVNLTKKLTPDLITMDIIMPNMDGIEAMRKIKKYDKNAIIVVVSSSGKEDHILNSFKEGAVGYMIKPFTIGEIEQEIGNIFPEYSTEIHEDNLDD